MNVCILDYGANITLKNNAPAIQAAIDACSASGGGRVTIPSGRFVTGTIYLKDDIELHLEAGAILKAALSAEYYNTLDAYPQNFACENEGWDHRHLMIAHEVTNIAVTGFGRIEGTAPECFEDEEHITRRGQFHWRDGVAFNKNKNELRPGQLMAFVESTNVHVSDITITDSPCWSCFFHGCDYVAVRGVKILNDMKHKNTDGLDIDSCRFVTVSDCIITTGDDCIAIRGSAQRLSDPSRVCENITVTNSILACSVNAFRIGVGYGKVQSVRISNIVVHHAGNVIEFCTSYKGWGHTELDDISFSGISAKNVVRLFEIPSEDVNVSRVMLENIRAEVMAGSYIRANRLGVIEDVTLRNIDLYIKPFHISLDDKIRAERGEYFMECVNISDLRVQNVRCIASDEVKKAWIGEQSIENCGPI